MASTIRPILPTVVMLNSFLKVYVYLCPIFSYMKLRQHFLYSMLKDKDVKYLSDFVFKKL